MRLYPGTDLENYSPMLVSNESYNKVLRQYIQEYRPGEFVCGMVHDGLKLAIFKELLVEWGRYVSEAGVVRIPPEYGTLCVG
jgi:hypothetical protein